MDIFMSVIPFLILLFRNEFVDALRSRIVDGSATSKNEIPFIVSLQKHIGGKYQHSCGGSLITESVVLTAAHCTLKNFDNARVLAGLRNLKKSLHEDNIRYVDTVIRHGCYQYQKPKDHDVALVKLKTPFNLQSKKVHITLARLPAANYAYTPGTKIVLAGWGKSAATSTKGTSTLQKTEVKIISYDECQDKYTKKNSKSKILVLAYDTFCTKHDNLNHNRGACEGDSGGPVIDHSGTLVGVIKGSFYESKPQCGSATYPDIHVQIVEVLTWINEKKTEILGTPGKRTCDRAYVDARNKELRKKYLENKRKRQMNG